MDEQQNKRLNIMKKYGSYSDQDIEIAEKIKETLQQFQITYSSAVSALDLTKELLGESVIITNKQN